MKRRKTKEPQNQIQFDTYQERGPVKLGPWTSHIWRTDPRHLAFLLARYKFCAKMLAGKSEVLEVGCGDALGIPVVLQTVKSVHGVDFEPLVIEDAKARLEAEGVERCSFSVLDITERAVGSKFDAAYSLDVIEHIPPESEDRFMVNICSSLRPHAVCIIGTPNIEAQKHASPASAAGHVNLKSAESLRKLLLCYFHNVFIFSMNDEVVHTGFYPMAHYLLGLGVGVKEAEAKI
ncbi:class I SAM-dependent methyltransferase [bacterium]|nr:class I SAM-dependent methyltransferase [bacterium]